MRPAPMAKMESTDRTEGKAKPDQPVLPQTGTITKSPLDAKNARPDPKDPMDPLVQLALPAEKVNLEAKVVMAIQAAPALLVEVKPADPVHPEDQVRQETRAPTPKPVPKEPPVRLVNEAALATQDPTETKVPMVIPAPPDPLDLPAALAKEARTAAKAPTDHLAAPAVPAQTPNTAPAHVAPRKPKPHVNLDTIFGPTEFDQNQLLQNSYPSILVLIMIIFCNCN